MYVHFFLGQCSKGCGKAAAPYHHMCRACAAAYKREYRKACKISESRAVQRARKDGFEACRLLAIEAFSGVGMRDMNGITAAQIMRELN